MHKFFLGLSAAAMLALMPAATLEAQSRPKEKAPAGCISCEALCNWCISLGLQSKDNASKCHGGCRAWGSMVGLNTIYVHKNKSLCGTNNYAPRCN